MEHLVLVDGHHMMYRAYWAIPRTMKTKAGEQVNTVFGMASMLLNIITTEQPDALLICFDEGSQTFRHQENETYKDGRAETPDDFYSQIPRVFEMLQTFDFSVTSNPKYEADDLLATYAIAAANQGMRATIVSGDKDLYQIASDNIRIAIPHKGYQAVEYLDPEGVVQKLGIRPDQVASYKGLCGDSSDNLPGVAGIGPKTAAKLIQEYGSLSGIYDHIDEIKGGVADKLRRDKEQAFFCERMAELITDIDLPIEMKDLQMVGLPAQSALRLFSELDFTLLTRRLVSLLDTSYGIKCFSKDGVEEATKKVEKNSEDQLSLF